MAGSVADAELPKADVRSDFGQPAASERRAASIYDVMLAAEAPLFQRSVGEGAPK